ncbi:glycosyltransferase [uncultured Arthrobacter sp.]|uniref:glycosyltransferase n=1 Tax=uncultured Arthrobacter sp. TaxID=114050 RepID=UPI003216ED9E
MSKPHLLYIAFAFPPSTASSVYRCTAVANAFAEDGWDVTVLTLDRNIWSEISGVDQKLADSVDPRIRVVQVDDGGSEEPARGDLRRFSRLRIEAPYLWKEVARRRGRKDFPEDFHGAWLAPASAAARSIHAEKPVDLVMASAGPYVSFGVARCLEGVPYIMDYRDAWAFNTFSEASKYTPDSKQGRFEAEYLCNAAQVWFVNGPIRDEYARRYPDAADKMRVVENGFDPQPGHGQPPPRQTTTPTFGYLGTLLYERMPTQEFLDGWRQASTGEGSSGKLHAVFRGKMSSSGAASAEVLRAFADVEAFGLRHLGPISKRDVAKFYNRLDALVLLLPSGKYVTGGKTAEYLATGLPIVSVHDLGIAATYQLKDYPLWFPAKDLTPESIAAALQACADALAHPDSAAWQAAWEYGQQFARSAILAPVISDLRRLVGHPLQQPVAEVQRSPKP